MLQPFTSESVTEGHPDKLADQISDAILDECLRQDAQSRVAVETLLTRGLAVIAGEITTHAYVEIPDVVRRTINEVGYTRTEYGFEGDTCGVVVAIQEQSPNIGQGVDRGGAGDQGMMFGFACNETPELMPLPITVAHALTRQLSEVRRANPELGFRPDGKSQVTVLYENGVPKAIDTVVVSAQHDPELTQAQVRERVLEYVVQPVLERFADRVDIKVRRYYVNPTGVFVIGGPQADTGVTGRKIIVDTYGGFCRHGGGAFSGKDPTKVDRSASYMARYLAKNIVAAGIADRVEIQLSYAIGVEQPVSLLLETFGTHKVDPAKIVKRIQEAFDLSPRGIIQFLDLQKPQYLPTAKNGHFGNPSFRWEHRDSVSVFADLA
ncbi:MAG: methionine adenosyltransferase [Armatimonadota bacterium]|jgi:S-adenosylmethionine synthetase|nr:methionine adenosyltransferase [Armatimonadota bacterium]